ncbi:MAG: DUF815 domain-containing protein [Victivallaceae bacterium]
MNDRDGDHFSAENRQALASARTMLAESGDAFTAALLRVADAPGTESLHEFARAFAAAELTPRLSRAFFDALTRYRIIPDGRVMATGSDSAFLFGHLRHIHAFLRGLPKRLEARGEVLLPSIGAALRELPELATDEEFAAFVAAGDPFANGRAYRWLNARFEPARLESIRAVDRFYGFAGVRRIFREHYKAFAGGKPAVPLLISSLPGHGKTQLTIAYALSHPELTLILAPGDTLETNFETLIDLLRLRPDRRFVIFFDDLDPAKIDWYTFRTHVGGSFSPPDHVLLALASNFEFPANILSRGRSVLFPTFDDVRCQEMVEDFLAVNGFRHPNRNLISLIAATYTEEFGQKRYTELSPRTLIRHLAVYENDRRRRRDIVELACGPMVTKPDPELFYEFNIRLMRKLYGKEYIEDMLKDKLKALE